MSTELGNKSLCEENKKELAVIKGRIASNDPSITNVDLANRFIGDQGIITNINCLKSNSSVIRLDLSFNSLTEASVPAIIDAITASPQLRILDLAGNRIGEKGCQLLGEYLSANPLLEELYVFHNDLYDKAIVPFANALLRNDNLAVLNIDQNNLTNASWMMLHKAIAGVSGGNKGLIRLKVGTRADIVPSDALVEDIQSQLNANKVQYDEKKALERQKDIDAAARKEQEELARDQARRQAAEDAQRAQNHEEELERQRILEEEEMRAYEAQISQQKQRSLKKTKEEVQAQNEMWVARAMDQAYDWRKKLTQDGTMVKEWKDGFTTLTTQPGDEVGSKPTATIGPPRRLQACWCDPHDVSVPYAKTLHYHCKHEDLNRPLQDGQVPKYEGCYASGHVCASVGFYTEPKPDLSAAHFFSSPQRAAREDGNDVYEDGNMTNASLYTRSQTAASNSSSPPAAAITHRGHHH